MKPKTRQWLGCVAVGIVASVIYGVIHDQITVRICLEYFTVWHPFLIDSQDPTTVGLAWGVAATWWCGAILGGLLGAAAVASRQPSPIQRATRSIALVMAATAAGALLAGLVAWQTGFVTPSFVMGPEIAALGLAKQRAFSICYVVHNASYFLAFVGSIMAAIGLQRPATDRQTPT